MRAAVDQGLKLPCRYVSRRAIEEQSAFDAGWDCSRQTMDAQEASIGMRNSRIWRLSPTRGWLAPHDDDVIGKLPRVQEAGYRRMNSIPSGAGIR